ncbi:unnamed protein product [Meloidogyne enterolobii]|uniref:Uncharacterized protein n=1 Tax=Meloidogyne enterolobii TaxID=390850 RepID=A0ACB0XQQ0_MELEN
MAKTVLVDHLENLDRKDHQDLTVQPDPQVALVHWVPVGLVTIVLHQDWHLVIEISRKMFKEYVCLLEIFLIFISFKFIFPP